MNISYKNQEMILSATNSAGDDSALSMGGFRLNFGYFKFWKSSVGMRVAFAVFSTLFLAQIINILWNGLSFRQDSYLSMIKNQSLVAMASLIEESEDDLGQIIFDGKQLQNFFNSGQITGFSLYDYKNELLETYGEKPSLKPGDFRSLTGVLSAEKNVYEVYLQSTEINSPYNVMIKVKTLYLKTFLFDYFVTNLVTIILISFIITFVLMLALGRWLLEPLQFIKTNLIEAFKNPENPTIYESPYVVQDDVGSTISLIQKLILKNSENLISLRSTAEDKIHKLAFYDSLTGLPNRSMFSQKLSELARMIEMTQSETKYAIIAMDIDHFKDINDTMGHNVGDAILRSVGKKLKASLPESAVVARAGEDEFALMLPLVSDGFTAKDVGERVINIMRAQPFKIFNEEFQVRVSVGVSTFPNGSNDPDMALKQADIALNRAKEEGRDRLMEYTEDFDRAVQERFQMLRDLRDALEHDQLTLHFQPQLDLHSGQIIGVEALLRWWKPDNSKEGGKYVSPAQFIPVAEQSGLIVPIGHWVMNAACRAAERFKRLHDIDIRMAINVSGNQFVQGDICAFLKKTLRETGLDPARVELEVTESVFMDDINVVISILNNLHEIGVELAIDDFGTGYSSLSYLSQFPIDRLKIDQSFMRNALVDKVNGSIARTIINLGHSLDLKVIAEGVETIEHEKFLLEHGCDEVQGYRYSRPLPEKDLIAFIKGYNGSLDSFTK